LMGFQGDLYKQGQTACRFKGEQKSRTV
jgi:hypothetical protein